MKIILAPCGRRKSKKSFSNYSKTILNKVSSSEIRKFTDDFVFESDFYSVWGFKKEDRQRINKEDLILFYSDKKIISFGKIVNVFLNEDESFQEKYWVSKLAKKPWSTIVLIDKISEDIELTIGELNKIFSYKENNVVQGRMILDEEKTNKIMDFLALKDNKELSSYNYAFTGATDIFREIKIRKKQQKLRQALLANTEVAKCSICKKDFPVELLWTSHILERKYLSEIERKDFKNIAVLMCVMGCDKLYENGFIIVDENGNIIKNHYKKSIEVIDNYIKAFENTKPINWNQETKIYYDRKRESQLNS